MGPLKGFKIVEIAGIGPGQLAGMLLADMGANVVRIDRPLRFDQAVSIDARFDILNRSRPLIEVDLKTPEGVELVLDLCEDADAIFEGFRPGVMERIGLGPDACMARNRKLVYGRMTGWGQQGPLAQHIGHDANFIGLAGVYACVGEKGGEPVYPMNLAGDMGGGGAYLVMGLLAALLEAGKSGHGQVVDAAMIDGAASQMAMIWGLRAAGLWKDERGSNILDGGAPFSRSYRTKDGKYMVVAPIENHFYSNLMTILGLDDIDPATQMDPSCWEEVTERLKQVFLTRTRQQWCDIFDQTETCVTPMLDMSEVASHPHNQARQTFIEVDGLPQPAPAPRFSRTTSNVSQPAAAPDPDIHRVLQEWGASADLLGRLAAPEQG